jgi:hypothetical protein
MLLARLEGFVYPIPVSAPNLRKRGVFIGSGTGGGLLRPMVRKGSRRQCSAIPLFIGRIGVLRVSQQVSTIIDIR